MLRVLAVLAVLALGPFTASAGAAGVPPRSFFGVMVDGPMIDGSVDVAREARVMRRVGVGGARMAMYWREIQPTERGPLNWAAYDARVLALARSRVRVLPVVLRAPLWSTGGAFNEGATPRTEDYARFLRLAIRRYGPQGSLWREHRDVRPLPIRSWQIWNEPETVTFWTALPWPQTYVALLKGAARAIRAEDPTARVVAAGVGVQPWAEVERIYAAGGRGSFDAIAIHPYRPLPRQVLILAARTRRVMDRMGDRDLPILITETSWPSARGITSQIQYGFEEDEAGQARRLRQSYALLVRARRRLNLAAVYWYTWMSPFKPVTNVPFEYSGLRRTTASGAVLAKPAFGAYAEVVGGWTAKRRTAAARRPRRP